MIHTFMSLWSTPARAVRESPSMAFTRHSGFAQFSLPSTSFNEERIAAAAIFACSARDLSVNANVPMSSPPNPESENCTEVLSDASWRSNLPSATKVINFDSYTIKNGTINASLLLGFHENKGIFLYSEWKRRQLAMFKPRASSSRIQGVIYCLLEDVNIAQ